MDHFRVDRGEAMLFSVDIYRALFKNRHHFSKEALAALHSSHIVTQGSPLMVGYKIKQFVTFLRFISFARILFPQQLTGFRHVEYLQRYLTST